MLLNHIGCKKKKKGITLIELIIAMSIDLIILSICFSIITVNYKNFKSLINYTKINSSLDDGVLTINRYLKTNMIEDIVISHDSDSITIKYRENHSKEGTKDKEIYFEKNDKKVAIRNLGESKNNPILINIEIFDIIKKGKIYYLKIRNINGEERIVCL